MQTQKNAQPNSISNCVDEHLAQLEAQLKETLADLGKDKITQTSINDAEFSEQELASLINQKKLQALLDESDGFINQINNQINKETDQHQF